MTITPLTEDLLAGIEGRIDGDVLSQVREAFNRSGHKVIVVDDDPTGTQTISDARLITTWDPADVDWLIAQPEDIGFILTNSRSLSQAVAVATNKLVGERIAAAAERHGRQVVVVSRSDSTLRGHFPHEVDALRTGGGFDVHGTLLVPFFREGGRITVHGTHYVRDGERFIGAGDTPFAQDSVFGFESSDLREWVEEKTNGSIPAAAVGLVDIDMVRAGGVDLVAAYLASLPVGSLCAVDAIEDEDLLITVAAVQKLERSGRRWMYRSAASLVPALAGRRPALPAPISPPPAGAGGLVIVGSHVPLSTSQLNHLVQTSDVEHVEVDVEQLLTTESAGDEIGRAQTRADAAIGAGRTVVISTSRDLVTRDDPLATSTRVAEGLCTIVKELAERPAFLVAKGGITSHTIAVDALGARRAAVIGPLIAGVPMWGLDEPTKYPGMPYVVFPGNVGTETSLAEAVDTLEGARR